MMGAGVRFAHQRLLRRGEGDRMIVLVTDGESSDIGDGSGRNIAAQLAEDKIVLHAIFVGTGSTPHELYDLSRPTKGQVFMATNPDSLSTIFGQIDRMTPVKLKPVATRLIDEFAPFSIAGLMLLGLYQSSLLGVRYTPW
jgi:Ca-activated chloride channel family protein